jgi:hypothetical protein
VSNRHQDGVDLKGLAAVLHELHGLPIGVQYAVLAVVVIIVIASIFTSDQKKNHLYEWQL